MRVRRRLGAQGTGSKEELDEHPSQLTVGRGRGAAGGGDEVRSRPCARQVLAHTRLARIQIPQITTLNSSDNRHPRRLLTPAVITMVRNNSRRLTAMRVLTAMVVRLQGLQPHAGAPHPEARPQHLRRRVW